MMMTAVALVGLAGITVAAAESRQTGRRSGSSAVRQVDRRTGEHTDK